MLLKISKLLLIFSLLISVSANVFSQKENKQYIIAGISVEGTKFSDVPTILALSGLRVGETLSLPGDTKTQTAIKNLWQRGQFSDIDILVEKITGDGVFLLIKVKEFPRLSAIYVEHNQELTIDEIKKGIAKIRGDIISPFDLYKAQLKVKKLYSEEGLTFAKVETKLMDIDSNNYAGMLVDINEGVEYYLSELEFEGNVAFDDDDLMSEFDDTHTKSWWQFWRSSKFNLKEYEKDKELLIKFYKNQGYRDAEILSENIDYNEAKEEVSIKINIAEGQKLNVRNIKFEGNTIYPTDLLIRRLDFKEGDPYNYEKFQMNLKGNEDQSDALSLYLDNGYLFAQMNLEEKRVTQDSVDLIVRVQEGDRVTINKVIIEGNTKTKDKVIRRELYTRPGIYFNRSAIIKSIKALNVLNYFNPEALRPDVKPVDNTKVDIVYKVEERSTDTFNASIGFAGYYGLTVSIGFTFNNFSLMEPLRGGAGQVFNFNLESGANSKYQSFAIGFTEPWLFDEPTTVGFNIYDRQYRYDFNLRTTGIYINLGRRFYWPDDYFRGDWSIGFLQNNVTGDAGSYYREGISNEITIGQTISRISLNNLFFPTSGSKFSFSTKWAMGSIGFGSTDYFKTQLKFEISEPLLKVDDYDRLILFLSTNLGYIDGFKSDTTITPLELFYMGGNGLSGIGNITPLRGYDDRVIGPYYGGKVMTRHIAELRFALALDPMPVFIYGFAEAGNVWSELSETNPFDLKRSAGLGVQMLLNPIGIVGFSYGYGFDPPTDEQTKSGWKFIFHLGGY